MSDITIILIVSVLCGAVAYFLYMRKELRGRNFGAQLMNGSGEGFYGKKDIKEDGSYIATKWFMVLFMPIIPLGTYRIWKGETSHGPWIGGVGGGIGFGAQRSTEIKTERLKLDWWQIGLTYFIALAILGSIISLIYFLLLK